MIEESLEGVFGSKSIKNVLWVGAVSFERRCTGSLEYLFESGFRIAKAIGFDYPTKLSPQNAGEQQRSINRKRMENLLGDALIWKYLNPYRYTEFIGELEALRRSGVIDPEDSADVVVFDITCLTKIHTAALAYWLLWRMVEHKFAVAYSQPDHYGNPSKNIWGKGKWRSPVLARLGLDSTDSYESTEAIILAGHEGDRLRLALSELELSGALVIRSVPRDPSSPLATVSNIQNHWLYAEIKEGLRPRFVERAFRVTDLASLCPTIRDYCETAKAKNARVVLCPFGPKPFVFVTVLASLFSHSNNVWLSYPQPFTYDPDYSDGYKYTLWLDPSAVRNCLREQASALSDDDIYGPQDRSSVENDEKQATKY